MTGAILTGNKFSEGSITPSAGGDCRLLQYDCVKGGACAWLAPAPAPAVSRAGADSWLEAPALVANAAPAAVPPPNPCSGPHHRRHALLLRHVLVRVAAGWQCGSCDVPPAGARRREAATRLLRHNFSLPYPQVLPCLPCQHRARLQGPAQAALQRAPARQHRAAHPGWLGHCGSSRSTGACLPAAPAAGLPLVVSQPLPCAPGPAEGAEYRVLRSLRHLQHVRNASCWQQLAAPAACTRPALLPPPPQPAQLHHSPYLLPCTRSYIGLNHCSGYILSWPGYLPVMLVRRAGQARRGGQGRRQLQRPWHQGKRTPTLCAPRPPLAARCSP